MKQYVEGNEDIPCLVGKPTMPSSSSPLSYPFSPDLSYLPSPKNPSLFPFFFLLSPVSLFLGKPPFPFLFITSASMASHHPSAVARLMQTGSSLQLGSPTPSKNIMKSKEKSTPGPSPPKGVYTIFLITNIF